MRLASGDAGVLDGVSQLDRQSGFGAGGDMGGVGLAGVGLAGVGLAGVGLAGVSGMVPEIEAQRANERQNKQPCEAAPGDLPQ